MNSYVPKVGDKVKATLGESVVVGEVTERDEEGFRVAITPAHRVWVYPEDGWQFEQVVSVPAKFGAVIRRADGEVFIYAPGYESDPCPWLTTSTRFFRPERATAGGFTILFDGVDE